MRIRVSFHSPSLWRSRGVGILCIAAGLLAVLAVAGAGWAMHADMNRWSVDLQALRAQRATHIEALDEKTQPEIKTELQAANQIIERLNTPWSMLFASLEGVYSENAILLGIEPDPIARSIRLTAESKDTASMLEFVRQLRAAKIFGDAYVVSHVVNQNDMQRPIRFSVASHWLDVVPEQTAAGQPAEEEEAAKDAVPTAQQVTKREGESS